MQKFKVKSISEMTDYQRRIWELHDSLDFLKNGHEVNLTLDDLVCKPRDKAHEKLIDLGMLIAADIVEVS